MKLSKTTLALAIAGLSAPAAASTTFDFQEVAPADKVDVCVAEVGNRADYTGAVRVIHDVESEQRPSFGHRLVIDTTILSEGDTVIREYATVCVVANGDEPVSFRIRERS